MSVPASCAPIAGQDASVPGQDWPRRWQSFAQGVGVGRYTDPAFLKLEFEKLWSRVWQVAARVDEIPEPGDYTTYRIGKQSVLLLRVTADSVKAYYNFCPHRGTTLGEGSGHFENGRIICPFHGWRWSLAGNIQMILERHEFKNGELRDADVQLREVHSVLFAGFVFINLDEQPQSFDAFIAPLRRYLEDFALEQMHPIWWKKAPVPANWKVAQEAFYEAYHVSATHPQLEKVGREIVYGEREDGDVFYRNIRYDALAQGHGRFFGGEKTPIGGHVQEPSGDRLQAMAERMNLTAEGLGAMITRDDIQLLLSLRDKNLPPDANLGAEYVKVQYETAARQQRPMPRPDPEILAMWGGVIVLFPNVLILPQAGNAAIYRVLPDADDPDRCTFEIISVKTYPAGVQPPRASLQLATDIHDPEQLGLIPRQDMSNIPRIQEGLHSQGMKQTYLAAKQERLILNMHQRLDVYLQG
ncbi:Rieske [2Fe-2S] domain-containing protein [Solimonas aquatica]|uniref:Rieske [2Fe-2S] domain-containing protein n=1 Tax=Solimonas aquatica TaxID=489703 RepID=A0A1H9KB27_9GAMM|nr:SRPBCC family protein [Solimonas aquatica]SEQ96331.1 Rieske [2Fe-2S] domain-containing protein [Solimonas aquatica]